MITCQWGLRLFYGFLHFMAYFNLFETNTLVTVALNY